MCNARFFRIYRIYTQRILRWIPCACILFFDPRFDPFNSLKTKRYFPLGQLYFTLKKKKPLKIKGFSGDPSEARTPDTLIKSQVLCQLS